jgi:hypothetical protein
MTLASAPRAQSQSGRRGAASCRACTPVPCWDPLQDRSTLSRPPALNELAQVVVIMFGCHKLSSGTRLIVAGIAVAYSSHDIAVRFASPVS